MLERYVAGDTRAPLVCCSSLFRLFSVLPCCRALIGVVPCAGDDGARSVTVDSGSILFGAHNLSRHACAWLITRFVCCRLQERFVREALSAAPKLVADYQKARDQKFVAQLFGRAMRAAQQRVVPSELRTVLMQHLEALPSTAANSPSAAPKPKQKKA
jgi:hypothetical protein